MRQQARSSALICASGTKQAIAGAKHETNSKTNTPNWRKKCITKTSLRPEVYREQGAFGLRKDPTWATKGSGERGFPEVGQEAPNLLYTGSLLYQLLDETRTASPVV
jgi:hypothetical protein